MFRDNTDQSRFEWEEGGHVSFADYIDYGAFRALPHVETPVAARGGGAAGRLMAAIADHARTNGIMLRATCPYAVAWFRRHPEAGDLLA